MRVWVGRGLLVVTLIWPSGEDSTNDLHLRHRELIARIQSDMLAVDRLLLEAEAGAARDARKQLQGVSDEIPKLLEDVRRRQLAVVERIEELIRLSHEVCGGS